MRSTKRQVETRTPARASRSKAPLRCRRLRPRCGALGRASGGDRFSHEDGRKPLYGAAVFGHVADAEHLAERVAETSSAIKMAGNLSTVPTSAAMSQSQGTWQSEGRRPVQATTVPAIWRSLAMYGVEVVLGVEASSNLDWHLELSTESYLTTRNRDLTIRKVVTCAFRSREGTDYIKHSGRGRCRSRCELARGG